jgi:hypothetical protein
VIGNLEVQVFRPIKPRNHLEHTKFSPQKFLG